MTDVTITAVDDRGNRLSRSATGKLYAMPIWYADGSVARTYVHDIYVNRVMSPPDHGYLEIKASA